MKDTYSCTKPQTFPSKSKNNSHFIYKAIIFAIFIPMLPQFLPQFSKTKDITGKWEFVQLILAGVAVYYGLFNRTNNGSDKNDQNLDRMDSYSDIFEVSSFFDDENDYQSGSNDSYAMKVRKSQYLKRDPLVVLEQEDSIFEKERSTTFEIVEKPVFLPLRSLKTRNLDLEEKVEESCFLQNQSKSHNWEGNKSMNSKKGAKLGKSVRTIRKCKSNTGDLQNRGLVEEMGSKRRTCLEIFDFRDYENRNSYNSEGFNCNNESDEGRDVDKKADEFIAKFREQIRLQRTEL